MKNEGIHASIGMKFGDGVRLPSSDEQLPPGERSLYFALECNGFAQIGDEFVFEQKATDVLTAEMKPLSTAFFGPNLTASFFRGKKSEEMLYSLWKTPVLDVISKYRTTDPDLAARLAFLFGGMVRHYEDGTKAEKEKAQESVEFVAKMAKLGEGKSVEAIASAATMYVLTGGTITEDPHFREDVYRMGRAMEKDTVTPQDTVDLGLSQIDRLRRFFGESAPLPDIAEELAEFEGFPTAGAEFHFPLASIQNKNDFWQRLALLNISQFQKGSYIQFSRIDNGVVEVRMNPSVYPVTIANWKHMQLLFPELRKSYFHTTINRRSSRNDFLETNEADGRTVSEIRGLGLLSYAAMCDEVVTEQDQGELAFGNTYIGQTVRMNKGRFEFSGKYAATQKDSFGQLSIYAGYGQNLDRLTYYPSFALAHPDILSGLPWDFLNRIRTVGDALVLTPEKRQEVFSTLERAIASDPKLRRIQEAGRSIMTKLLP